MTSNIHLSNLLVYCECRDNRFVFDRWRLIHEHLLNKVAITLAVWEKRLKRESREEPYPRMLEEGERSGLYRLEI
jgi:hypothetical protein